MVKHDGQLTVDTKSHQLDVTIVY